MTVSVGDRIIEAKVMEKEAAQGRYDDAIASGHTAALVKDFKHSVDLL